MKKIIICSIPMKKGPEKSVYVADDVSLNVSDRAVIYPVNAFLEKNMKSDDEVKMILLIKRDAEGNYKENFGAFTKEILSINADINAKIEFKPLETDFVEKQVVYDKLMGMIVDEIDDGSCIIADITYGPKDVPIVLFTALNFAEKFLSCEIDKIIYGQADFVGGKATNTRICDMSSLYYLNSVTETICGDDPEKSRKILKSLLSL